VALKGISEGLTEIVIEPGVGTGMVVLESDKRGCKEIERGVLTLQKAGAAELGAQEDGGSVEAAKRTGDGAGWVVAQLKRHEGGGLANVGQSTREAR